MSTFDRLLDEKQSLDRQVDNTTDSYHRKAQSVETVEELVELARQSDIEMEAFRRSYVALSQATVEAFNRPWWKVW